MIRFLGLDKDPAPLSVRLVAIANINHVSGKIVGERTWLDGRIQLVECTAQSHRAQLLLECASRAALQSALRAWQPALRNLRGVLRWSVEVDPLDI